jgi:MscS family membrane protein
MLKVFLLKTFLVLLIISNNYRAQIFAETDSASTQLSEVYSIESDFTKHPLKPVDTSSPRATLQSFIENTSGTYRILMLAHKENQQARGIFTPDSIVLKEKEAEELFQRSVRCLNLGKIPETLKESIGYRRTIILKEILDRIELPPLNKVPDEASIVIKEEEGGVAELTRWRIPNTDIVIARVEDDPRKNEYLFSPETIDRLDEFYNKIKELPYRSERLTTPGFYNFYISSPGKFLPPKWGQWLPEWSKAFFLEQTIWQWLFFLIYIFISCILFILLYRWFNPWDITHSPLKRNLRRISFLFLLIIIILGLFYLDRENINMTGFVKIVFQTIGSVVFWLLLSIFTLLIFKVLAETIIASPKINPVDIQASYIRAVFTVTGFILASIIFVFGLSRVGVSLAPLLAGVGIGGIAIALAARPTLENIIGSFMIFADKPFKVGQRIKVTGYEGTVQEIGLRSTKIRLLNGNVTSIPNEKMVTLEIENIGRRPYIRREFNICITYDTPPIKITHAVKLLNEILAVPKKPDQESASSKEAISETEDIKNTEVKTHSNDAINQPGFLPRIYFNDFNADSLNIYVSYWYHPPDWWKYQEHAHWINIQIKERFNAEGIEFAFPTQTIHLADEMNNQKQLLKDDTDK